MKQKSVGSRSSSEKLVRTIKRQSRRPAREVPSLRAVGGYLTQRCGCSQSSWNYSCNRFTGRSGRNCLSDNTANQPNAFVGVCSFCWIRILRRVSVLLHRQRTGADHRIVDDRVVYFGILLFAKRQEVIRSFDLKN